MLRALSDFNYTSRHPATSVRRATSAFEAFPEEEKLFSPCEETSSRVPREESSRMMSPSAARVRARDR